MRIGQHDRITLKRVGGVACESSVTQQADARWPAGCPRRDMQVANEINKSQDARRKLPQLVSEYHCEQLQREPNKGPSLTSVSSASSNQQRRFRIADNETLGCQPDQIATQNECNMVREHQGAAMSAANIKSNANSSKISKIKSSQQVSGAKSKTHRHRQQQPMQVTSATYSAFQANQIDEQCAKCQLIVEWTLAQAARAELRKLSRASKGTIEQPTDSVEPTRDKMQVSKAARCARAPPASQLQQAQRRVQCRRLGACKSLACLADCEQVSSLTDSTPSSSLSSSLISSITANKMLRSKTHNTANKLGSSATDIARRKSEQFANFEILEQQRRHSTSKQNKPIEQNETVTEIAKNASNAAPMKVAQYRRPAPSLPLAVVAPSTPPTSALRPKRLVSPSLLLDSELFSLEHSLRSLKSSVYVAGCIADLYLTSTSLADNGRVSRPETSNWRLNQTGVPILTFDSGLARSRQRRQLRIHLVERHSALVLWSDTINHLSGYRSAPIEWTPASVSSPKQNNDDEDNDEDENENDDCGEQRGKSRSRKSGRMHQMYLSSDHRTMAGLKFHNCTCARLFLAQIELVTSDPKNISLNGPGSRFEDHKNRSLWPRLAQGRTRKFSSLSLAASAAASRQRDANISAALCPSSYTRSAFSSQAASQWSQDSSRQTYRTSVAAHPTGTWSTLKRAIRSGIASANFNNNNPQNASSQHHKQKWPLSGDASRFVNGYGQTTIEDDEENKFIALLKPKPLVLLATSGKSYRSARNMPRKCDISAPCLFQHVTTVSVSQLGVIQSSLNNAELAVPGSMTDRKREAKSPAASVTTSGNKLLPLPTKSCIESKLVNDSKKLTAPDSSHSVAGGGDGSTSGFTSCSISESSSVSCASSSDAVCSDHSDSGAPSSRQDAASSLGSADNGARQTLTSPTRSKSIALHAIRSHNNINNSIIGSSGGAVVKMARPPPPPPIRVPELHRSKNLTQQWCETSSNSLDDNRGDYQGSSNKIQDIIRDIEAHAPAEMVNAKRLLMTDIAGQFKRNLRKLKETNGELDDSIDEPKLLSNLQSCKNSMSIPLATVSRL